MSNAPQEQSRLTEEDFKRNELDRQSYDKTNAEQAFALDKYIITISGASFGIAIAFIDKIIDKDHAFAFWMFWFAMVFFVLAIIATTLSFHWSVKAFEFARASIDESEIQNDMSLRNRQNPNLKWLLRLNKIRLWTFTLGMALLALFILLNGIYQSYWL